MPTNTYLPAEKPTFYFIGVSTAQSSIMRVFPAWMQELGLGEVVIKGIDLKVHDEPANYRQVLSFIKEDPLSVGALVTTHKIDLLAACRDLFDELDPYALLTGEISCISKRGASLRGHAKDPITAGLALEAFLPADHWEKTNASALVLGAGGAGISLTAYLLNPKRTSYPPRQIIITDRNVERLQEVRAIHQRLLPSAPVKYRFTVTVADSDELFGELPPRSLVVNATGLGKDAPGSPITDAARFPEHGYAWEFNYRGNLVFLEQARRQQQEQTLHVEDGWRYFIHGWTRVIAEVFGIDIPVQGEALERLSQIAAAAR